MKYFCNYCNCEMKNPDFLLNGNYLINNMVYGKGWYCRNCYMNTILNDKITERIKD